MASPYINTYALNPDGEILIEPLDVMTVIYQRRSGITHLVAEPIPQILKLMSAIPETAEDIAHRLSAAFDISDDAVVAAQIVAARLEEMAELGLLDRPSA